MYDSKKYRLSRPRTTARRAFGFDGKTFVETEKLLRLKLTSSCAAAMWSPSYTSANSHA
jgi:hypothetical protein